MTPQRMPTTADSETRAAGRRLRGWLVAGLVVPLVGLGASGEAAEFTCAAGNVACLITAIGTANGLGQPSTIHLGEGTYRLTAVDNDTDGPNGLASVTQSLTIQGAGAQSTIIERAADAPDFRLMHVAPTGALTLDGLTLRGGSLKFSFRPFPDGGGGIFNNGGQVTLSHSRLAGNRVTGGDARGGGLFNDGGTVILNSSTLTENSIEALEAVGGGLATRGGSVTMTNCTIVDNRVSGKRVGGGGVADSGPGGGSVEIVNCTIAGNTASGTFGVGGGISTQHGLWTITNSTIAGNTVSGIASGGGGIAANGPVSLQNTIVALNTFIGNNSPRSPDCAGLVTSSDHNLIGDPTGCTVALQPHDRTGDPGFGVYTDDGTPGHGHLPLAPTSPAIDAGDANACPPTDQLGRPRVGTCDIGAVEFYSAPLAAFVTRLYENALGREPSPTDTAGWLGFLQPDPTLARARFTIHAFFDGPEYRARPVTPWSYVTALYRAILGREPEAAGLDGWVRVLLDRRDAAVSLFIGSPEFHSLVPDCRDAPTIAALVTRLYETGLGRTPSMDEVTAWTTHIVTTCALEGDVTAFLNSTEYLGVPRTLADHVTVLYRTLLAREPGVDETTPWVSYLAEQLTFIEDQFIDSAEFHWQPLFR